MNATGSNALLAGGASGGIPVYMMIVRGDEACNALKKFHAATGGDGPSSVIPPEYPDYTKN